MRISTFRNFGAMNSPPVFDAFTQSVKKKGWEVVDHDMSADVAVIWSVLWNGRMLKNKDVWDHFRKQGKPVIVLEVGGLDRGILWKVAVNGINGDGYFGPKENDDKRRKKLNIWPKPWYKTHDIIICSQHGNSHQWDGMPPISQWIEETISKLRTYTDRKIIIRPHPRFSYNRQDFFKDIVVEYPREITSTYDSFNFEEKLKTAWAIVNWNSNPATQAAIDGVPVFVGPSSLAAPVGNLDWSKIENPDTPDREQWVNDIAYTEWSVDEISGGEPLDRLSQALHY